MTTPIRKLKLFGERNTGTTWLRRLVDANLEVGTFPGAMPEWVRRVQRVLPGTDWLRDLWFDRRGDTIFGWKHMLVDPRRAGFVERARREGVGFVCIVKHPASWVLSLHNRPYDHHWGPKGDLASFVTSPWFTVRRERADVRYPDPIRLWNAKCAAYLELAQHVPTVLVRYEDLVSDPEARIDEIAKVFGVARRVGGFRNQNESTKRDDRSFEDYQRYYAAEAWRAKLSKDVAREIAARIDADVMARLGYAPFAG